MWYFEEGGVVLICKTIFSVCCWMNVDDVVSYIYFSYFFKYLYIDLCFKTNVLLFFLNRRVTGCFPASDQMVKNIKQLKLEFKFNNLYIISG